MHNEYTKHLTEEEFSFLQNSGLPLFPEPDMFTRNSRQSGNLFETRSLTWTVKGTRLFKLTCKWHGESSVALPKTREEYFSVVGIIDKKIRLGLATQLRKEIADKQVPAHELALAIALLEGTPEDIAAAASQEKRFSDYEGKVVGLPMKSRQRLSGGIQ